MADELEDEYDPSQIELGKIVRNVWIQWAKEQPDMSDHPNWTTPWDNLPRRDKDVDCRIAIAVIEAYERAR